MATLADRRGTGGGREPTGVLRVARGTPAGGWPPSRTQSSRVVRHARFRGVRLRRNGDDVPRRLGDRPGERTRRANAHGGRTGARRAL